jgi:hypothetical protein
MAALALAAGGGIFAFLLSRDLSLPEIHPPTNLPDVVVESLDLDRTVEGARWRIAAARVERSDGVTRAASMDVAADDGRRNLEFKAASGEIREDPFILRLAGVEGTQMQGAARVRFSAPTAEFRQETKIWLFPEGVRLTDGHVAIRGGSARAERSGAFTIRKEVSARWSVGSVP